MYSHAKEWMNEDFLNENRVYGTIKFTTSSNAFFLALTIRRDNDFALSPSQVPTLTMVSMI